MAKFNWSFGDYFKRKQVKQEILALLRTRCPALGDGICVEGLDFQNPDPKANVGMALAVLQEILSEHRGFSLIQWPSGPAIVRTGGVDLLPAGMRTVNEAAGFVVRGGSDAAADLAENPGRPTSGTAAPDVQVVSTPIDLPGRG